MDRNKGIWIVILCILVVGGAVTFATDRLVRSQESAAVSRPHQTDSSAARQGAAGREDESDGSVPQGAAGRSAAVEESSITADSDEAAAEADSSGRTEARKDYVVISPLEAPGSTAIDPEARTDMGAYYRSRLEALDVQIRKMRSQETDSTTYSMVNAAENERKLWENELDRINAAVLSQMDEGRQEAYREEAREWMKERDADAAEAARKYSGGSIEGLEYTASLADSTRERAYDMVELYMPAGGEGETETSG